MKTVLIIGASRGLGLEFVRQYRADGWLTLGTCRSPAQDALLASVGATALRLDVNDENGYGNLAKALNGASIDVCIYNAGVLGPKNSGAIACPEAEFDAVFHTNVLGAMRAIPMVAPSLVKSSGTFVFISSLMGSIGSQASTSRVTYRASKAALNMVMHTAAIEWGPKGVKCISMHPGWVKTDMGGSDADIEPALSIAGMRKVIAGVNADANGKFFDYTGKELSW